MFNRILIANRGEIACRVIKTCRRMGIETVAVYSDADAKARHVRLADVAVHIGGSKASESYLNVEAVLAAAKQTGAEAIHPGYGFLSENTTFAKACKKAGIVFIGPSAEAIEAMGDKAKAKALMEKHKVPTLPGYHGSKQDAKSLLAEAEKIGYPVLLKAVAGGGGRGMRRVDKSSEFNAALESARREAENAFGNGDMLIEKYIINPRHVEVQVFGDNHGNVIHFFERDCSLQRRHQKVVEEAPAPGLTEEQRKKLGEAAVAAAKAVDYSGAGTVEFLYAPDGRFYFMEMNTRLQVEHPVTEMIVGMDLVELQLQVAAGGKLPLAQKHVDRCGHAFEVRIYAEDPANGFAPSVGKLTFVGLPEGEGVRVDTGVESGDEISPYYDAMIAKLITVGSDRDEALERLQHALENTHIVGVKHNVDYLWAIANDSDFVEGHVHTGLLAEKAEELTERPEATEEDVLLAAFVQVHNEAQNAAETAADPFSPWGENSNWRLSGYASRTLRFEHGGENYTVTVQHDGTQLRFNNCPIEGWEDEEHLGWLTGDIGDETFHIHAVQDKGTLSLWREGRQLDFTLHQPLDMAAVEDVVDGRLIAPIPGVVVKVDTATGAIVKKGAPLMVLEAMKTEHHITAPADGTVEAVHFNVGDSVDKDALLIAFTVKA